MIMGNDKRALLKLLRHLSLIFVIALGLMTIIGSGQGQNDAGGTATGTGTTTTVTSISLVASPANLSADGVSTSAITARVNSSVADGKTISFSISPGIGTLSASSAATSGGNATVTYTAGTTPGIDTISANADDVSGETTIQLTGVPNSFSLSLSQTSVKSDNSDSSTVTATVLDNNKVPVEGIQVTFTATGGMISSATAITDEKGEAAITFSSGTTEKKNQVVTIIASVTGFDPKQIPILVTGTELLLYTDRTGLEVNPSDPDVSTATLTIILEDAGQAPIYDALVSISLDATSTGAVTFDSGLTTYQNNTDINGELEVEVTGTIAGDAIVKVEALGTKATQTYTVDVIGESFKIISPTEDPYSLSTNTNLTITVNAPDQTDVLFSTTFGTLTGTNEIGQAVKETVSGGAASIDLSSTSAGVATVQASDFNDASTKDLMSVIISAPSSEASQLALQANATVVAPSTADLSNAVILTATVRNASDQVVSNAPVLFSIDNDTATGGGETISPAVVYTDDFGIATTTFTSGSLSSDADGVTVRAVVVGTAIASNRVDIVIGGTAASVVIGTATKVSSINNDTAYKLAMSVLVADSNGNPMKNTNVYLRLWPTKYAIGPDVETHYGEYDNEDVNRNLIMDTLEDLNEDGQLTPPSSAAGSLPSTVSTDDNGVADFNLVYLKSSASYIEAEITASTLVLGSETQSVTKFWLPWAEDETDNLGPSPYNIGFSNIIGAFNLSVNKFVLDADKNLIYASVSDNNSVAIINASTITQIGSIPVGSNPMGLALSPDGSKLFVALSGAQIVTEVDTISLTTSDIPVPENPYDIEVDSGGILYITPLDTGNIMRIDSSDGSDLGSFSGGVSIGGAGFLEIDTDNDLLYFGNAGLSPSTLAKFDISGGVPVLLLSDNFGSNGQDLALSNDGSRIYYPCGAGNGDPPYTIFSIDTTDLTSTGELDTGAYPRELALSPSGSVAYTVNESGFIKIFDTTTYLVTGELSTGSDEAVELIVDASGQRLFAAFDDYVLVYYVGN